MARRSGENHPRALSTEEEVCLIRELYEEYPLGHPKHIGYRKLAVKFNRPVSVIRDICRYLTWRESPWDSLF